MTSLDTIATFGTELTDAQLADVDGGVVIAFAIGFGIGFAGAWIYDTYF